MFVALKATLDARVSKLPWLARVNVRVNRLAVAPAQRFFSLFVARMDRLVAFFELFFNKTQICFQPKMEIYVSSKTPRHAIQTLNCTQCASLNVHALTQRLRVMNGLALMFGSLFVDQMELLVMFFYLFWKLIFG
jgi:hypothetical protein